MGFLLFIFTPKFRKTRSIQIFYRSVAKKMPPCPIP